MIAPDTTTMNPDAAGESTEKLHCLPVSALAVEGTMPEVGDSVEYTVKGRVSRIEGTEAYVMPEMVNGEPAALAPEAGADAPDEMMAAARKADEQTAGMGY